MNGQRIRKNKTLLAIKAISLEPNLLANDRLVACALIEHYNRETGRCDPSLDRIAELLGISTRTVIRAVQRLVAAQLFRKRRHGGLSQRNSYQPNWDRFDAINENWRRRFKQAAFARPPLSPAQCQDSHLSGVADVTQTCLNNLSHSTEDSGLARTRDENALAKSQHNPNSTTMELIGKSFQQQERSFHVKRTRTLDAQHAAAERRWNADLLALYRSAPDQYALIIEGVDEPIAEAATQLEINQRGAGARFVIDELLKRGIRLAKCRSGVP